MRLLSLGSSSVASSLKPLIDPLAHDDVGGSMVQRKKIIMM
jgi:hypothetical protein